jgi:hypothetical protein
LLAVGEDGFRQHPSYDEDVSDYVLGIEPLRAAPHGRQMEQAVRSII